ncbi:MAG: autotransporter [Candidatus Eremiobacteraeota bacterium]|nr:autotransporter [Candidatus Eremiobacteraeota bacterium]
MAGRFFISLVLVLIFAVMAAAVPPVYGQQPSSSDVAPDKWPKTAVVNGITYTIYQPQLDSWDTFTLEAHAAVSALSQDSKEPVFGVVQISAGTYTDKVSRTVYFHDINVTKAVFPSAPDKAEQYRQDIQSTAANGNATMPLDQLQASLSILGQQQAGNAVPLQNSPPAVIFSQKPAVLVSVDGTPIWAAVKGSSLQRILNSRALVFKDSSGQLYLHLFDGFMEAPALSGPWTVSDSTPQGADAIAQGLAKQNTVDLMEGQPDDKTKAKPSLSSSAPDIYVVTTPTELVVTDGTPSWVPLDGTMLLYLKNTTGNVFKSLYDQRTYLLVTGRWFWAPDFKGPWQYIAASALPADFAKIPDASPKENAKASVPGTPQAQEALISNQIPQTATVNISQAKFTPQINGDPKLQTIAGTPLSYVLNSATPLIRVDEKTWYACVNGLWFSATSLAGTWSAATKVPAVIYSIPPSSPLYYVTFVKVYGSTPDTVTSGYTPGYMGTAVSPDNTIVYGTGYDYTDYYDDDGWYPAPVTYGYAANPAWTPWTNWAIGFGLGWAYGDAMADWCWGVAPYWGAMPYGWGYGGWAGNYPRWGPNSWSATTGNVYSRWGNTGVVTRTSGGYNAWTGNAWASKVGHSYNSVTGQISAGQRAGVENVYTGNYAYGSRGGTYNPRTGASASGERVNVGNAGSGSKETVGAGKVTGPGGQTTHVQQAGNNYYAERDGSVYRNTGSGWQQVDNRGSWNNVQNAGTVNSLEDHQWSRQAGEQRAAASSWGGDWGGGFHRAESFDRDWGGGGWGRSGGFGGFRGGFGGFRGGRR